ncbi:MAG: hypothetical protein AAF585_00610, partial [Verrucomicrobiota bacterium]
MINRISLVFGALLLGASFNLANAQNDSDSVPHWIWIDKSEKKETIYLRRQWTQSEAAKSVTLSITCDNGYSAFVNGKHVGSGQDWAKGVRFDIGKHVKKGDNVLAVEAANSGGVAGLVAQLKITNQDGSTRTIVTDGDWQASRKATEGWKAPSVDTTGWTTAISNGQLGSQPWGNPLASASKPGAANLKQSKPGAGGGGTIEAAKVHPEGFEIEKIYDVPKSEQGSWVSMAVDEKGRLYCSDQGDKGLYRIAFGDDGKPNVEKMPAAMTGAQGLLWINNALYAGINGGKPKAGLIRVTDSNGDDKLDEVEVLREMKGGGEHGPHAVVASPDGQSLYFFGGNHTAIPYPETSSVPLNYGEDQLLPSMPDARGHARNIKAPGGWVAKTDLDGKSFELVSAGFRNQYDGAFNAHGELFTYDSDMEWDLGTPWYRPTRIYHVTGGSEFGWRTGSGKFPEWFPDVLPPTLDIGPGSPTGVVSGLGAKFPAKYQNAIYAFDWTYGTMYAIHPVPNGASYTAEKEEFVTGVPLNLTDGVISPDGNMYFAVGGRGTNSALYRVSYTGSESTDPAPAAAGPEGELRELRHKLESYHRETEGAVEAVWPYLGHEDRAIRYAARMALEHQPVDSWIDDAFSERDPQALFSALLAAARQAGPEHQEKLLSRLRRPLTGELTVEQRLEALRVFNLSLIRMGEIDDATAEDFANVLHSGFPSSDAALNRETAYTLVALNSPGVIGKTVPLLYQQSIAGEGLEVDSALIARSARYGGAVSKTQESSHETQQLWYAYVLRNATEGWSPETRKEYFRWFAKARNYKGGASFDGFVENIRKAALANVPDEAERAELDKISKESIRLIPEGFEDARPIEVGCLPGLKFNTEEITAKAGEKVAIVFVNDDTSGLMHNLAVIAPGSADTVVAAALGLGASGIEKNFIPDVPELLAS